MFYFGPSIEGFRRCTSAICIDDNCLYRKHGDLLFIVTGIDANNQLFPLALAIVEWRTATSENSLRLAFGWNLVYGSVVGTLLCHRWNVVVSSLLVDFNR